MKEKILTARNWIKLDTKIEKWIAKGYTKAGITVYDGVKYIQILTKRK